ncbi:selenocysteine-specific translation elongation factor [Skermanella mucosa]|uniref:selenocysteine-specific translation elongation factor n=1 Tax=Skermanella mucosa TaxID=1789672 RepID=UPI00192BCD52|nr:selenocysteine-specific translation elongation factor [Skermanella mucosa]UEM21234.1 selenocysteine-specific translation elongation factor [Skermanella mucosa]
MRSALVGVIGHVDHGKTSLVKALTGIDTDRLEEEKRRGISIALGFAHLAVPGGEIGLIDMPGHERFVRTMISGATGIDAVLLVVAANEGIKPQTVEHVEIAGLIGVKRGIVAVAKCDLVDTARAEAAGRAACELARAAGIAEVTAVGTSAVTGAGLDRLREALGTLPRESATGADAGVFFLPADRVFAVAGFGTVATGTLRRGALRVGDAVEILPGGRSVRVRGLQVHGRAVEAAGAGRRTAVNLRGVERSDLARGDALATPGLLVPSAWLDAELRLLPSAGRDLRSGTVVRLLVGTTETSARVRLLDRDRLEPGDSAAVQLQAGEAVAVPAGEPFIIRTPSPPATVGGGRILDPASRRRRRHDAATLDFLRVLASGPPAAVVAARLRAAGADGCAVAELCRLLAVSREMLGAILPAAGAELLGEDAAILTEVRRDLECRVLALVEEHHRRHPTEPGLPRERLEGTSTTMAATMAAGLVRRGVLVNDGGRLRHRDFDPAALLSERDRSAIEDVEAPFREGGLTPPDIAAVVGSDKARFQAVRYLIRTGTLVRTTDRVQKRDILFHRDAVAKAKRIMGIHLADRAGGFLVADLGRLLGISRKFSIPLLEHLDADGFTRRQDDRRVIAGTGERRS